MQYLLSTLSIFGYYLIIRNPIFAYVIFIIQNIIAFSLTEQYYMIVNIIFCTIFILIKTKKK